MPSVFTLIGSAWEFFRKQPALHFATIWLVFLPELLTNLLQPLIPDPMNPAASAITQQDRGVLLGISIVILLLWVVAMWGIACVLIVGKRQLQKSAGRNRTSFKAVRAQARGYVLPLVLTTVIRAGMLVVWSLPAIAVFLVLLFSDALSSILPAPPAAGDDTAMAAYASALIGAVSIVCVPFLLPAIIYGIRTAFYQVATVCDDLPYRPALTRSIAAVRGRTGRVFLRLAGVSLTLFLPVAALAAGLDLLLPDNMPAADIAASAVYSAARALALVLHVLCLILLYKHLKPVKEN